MIRNHQPNLTPCAVSNTQNPMFMVTQSQYDCLYIFLYDIDSHVIIQLHQCCDVMLAAAILRLAAAILRLVTYRFISCSPIVRSSYRRYLCHLLSLLIISVKSFPILVAHTFVYNHQQCNDDNSLGNSEQVADSINYHLLLT